MLGEMPRCPVGDCVGHLARWHEVTDERRKLLEALWSRVGPNDLRVRTAIWKCTRGEWHYVWRNTNEAGDQRWFVYDGSDVSALLAGVDA